MSVRRLLFCSAPLFLVFISVANAADIVNDAHALLMKMGDAARKLNYQGTFVYQHGDQLESMRIVHKVEKGQSRESLVSLNGAAREVIRNSHEIQCFLPDEKSVMVEHRKVDSRSFPAIVPESLEQLDKHYVIQLGPTGRVADHAVRAVVIQPRDAYRYGYQLWADSQTDLPLKAILVDEGGHVVEQFMFTNVKIGGSIPDNAFKPKVSDKHFVWYRENGNVTQSPGRMGDWKVEHLPPGFTLSARLMRAVPTHKTPVEHIVYSDGLAVVSVFVEKIEAGTSTDNINGPIHVGAIHVFGKVVGDHQITVVGEVPARTVDLIGKSVVPGP